MSSASTSVKKEEARSERRHGKLSWIENATKDGGYIPKHFSSKTVPLLMASRATVHKLAVTLATDKMVINCSS